MDRSVLQGVKLGADLSLLRTFGLQVERSSKRRGTYTLTCLLKLRLVSTLI